MQSITDEKPSASGNPLRASRLPRLQSEPAASGHRLATTLRWLRPLSGLLALLLAFFAEQGARDARITGQPAPPQSTWVLFVFAGLFLVAAAWPIPRHLPSPPVRFWATLRSMPTRALFGVCLGLALLCALLSIPLFITLNTASESQGAENWAVNTGSWLLYITSLLLFGLAFVLWERGSNRSAVLQPLPVKEPGERLPARIEWLLILGLFLLAALLRLPNLDNVPPGLWFDEAQNGVVARNLLSPGALHPTFISGLTQMGALYFYLLGLLNNLFGNQIWVVRLLPALGGSLIVPMVYLIAARLYGWRAGLAAGGLLAVSAWHLTFSRFGMVSMFTITLDVAVYLCMMQALRTGRLGYFAGGGVLLGLALHGYYVARLVPVVLLALLLHRLLTERMRLVRALRTGIIVFAVGFLLGVLPVGLFALQKPEVYNGRVTTVSIFNPEGGGGQPDALIQSIQKHSLMFNFAGDNNGRHNLPGQPMLDWLTSALFFAGLASCALRAWRWQYFFPIAWFIAATSGGVLTLLFEAPQSHRTLEDSIITAIFAGIFLGELWRVLSRAIAPETDRPAFAHTLPGMAALDATAQGPPLSPSLPSGLQPPTTLPVRISGSRALLRTTALAETLTQPVNNEITDPAPGGGSSKFPPRPDEATPLALSTEIFGSQPPMRTGIREPVTRRLAIAWTLSVVGLLLFVGGAGAMNLPRYFSEQSNNMGVWKDMYSAETEAGRALARYSATHDVYVTPVYYSLPPSQYLAPGAPAFPFPGMSSIPLSPKSGKDVIIVLDPPSAGDLSLIARLYPRATFEILAAPTNPEPLVYTIKIPADDITALNGVRVDRLGTANDPVTSDVLSSMEAPLTGDGVVRISATLKVEKFGEYAFRPHLSAAANELDGLVVDGFPVSASQPISLAVGLHSLVLTSTARLEAGSSRLQWQAPGAAPGNFQPIPPSLLLDPAKIEPRGLTGLYRPGSGFSGPATYGTVDPVLSFYFHNTAMPRPYTVEWTGKLYIPTPGPYLLATEQLSTSRLFIDGREIIVNERENSMQEFSLTLEQGFHDLRLLFQDLSGFSHMYLYWTPPGGTRSIIPSAFLLPRMGSYPSTPVSGSWPTLANANGKDLPPDRVVNKPPPAPSPVAGLQQPTQAPQPPPSSGQPEPSVPGEPLQPILILGASDEPLFRPAAGAVDQDGNLYVFTETDGTVHKFSSEGKLLTRWTVPDKEGKPLSETGGLVVRGDRLLVLDATSSELAQYTLDGKLLEREILCQCYYPRGMSLARDGNLWVANTGGGQLLKVGSDAQVLAMLDARGSEPGQFLEPAAVWEGPDGTVYVADIGNSRVQRFTPDLKFRAQWPMGKSVARDGNRLAGSPDGNVAITQAEAKAVVVYNKEGKELRRWTYTRGAETLIPAGITAAGGSRFLVLYPSANLAVLFSADQ